MHSFFTSIAFALTLFLSSLSLSYANPLPRTLLRSDFSANHSLELRDGCQGVPCGWNDWLCCSSGQACSTAANNQATCVAAATAAGSPGTVVTTVYTIGGAVPTSSPGCSSTEQCGNSQCCLDTQWCNKDSLQCMPLGGMSSGAPVTYSQATTISNFIAPTSVGTATVTSAMSVTTTLPFETPVGSSGSAITGQMVSTNNGLSAGAIAGIVIGVIVGLIILFLILACLCCRSIFDAIFGRKKRKETTTYIETHHSHHGSGGAPPPPRRRFFGMLPGRPDRPEKKTSGFGGLLGVGALLATVAVVLGLRRRTKKTEQKTEYTGSDYTYSYDDYTTSASKYHPRRSSSNANGISGSASSDRRTRDTRRSRR